VTVVYKPVAMDEGVFAGGLVMEVCASSFGFSLNPFVSIYIFLCQPLTEDLVAIYSCLKVEDHLKVSWN